jgi:branched-chain amino acid transport system ATP-binding protein
MNTISGLVRAARGPHHLRGTRVDGWPAHRTVGEGLAHVLERRRLFPFLTVLDNVLLGAHNPAARPHRAETLARVEQLFPGDREPARPARPHAVGRRAADGGHRARAHGAARGCS